MGETMVIKRKIITAVLQSSTEGEISTDIKTVSTDDTMKDPSQNKQMMSAGIFKCPVCSAGYGQDCRPRNLRCGHTICSNCVQRYVDCPTKCPECFLEESYKNVSDFSVNYQLLRILSSPEGAEPLCDMKIPSILSQFCDFYSNCNEKWRCNKHDNPFFSLCCSCSFWICPDCVVFDHPLLPRGSCRTIGLDNAVKIMKKEQENKMNDLLNDIGNFRKIYEDKLAAMHKFCLDYCSCYRRTHDRPIQCTDKFCLDYCSCYRRTHDRPIQCTDKFCLEYCSCNRRTHDRLIQCTDRLLVEVNKNNESFVKNAKDKVEKLKMSVNLDTSPKDMASIVTETLAYKDELRTNIKEHEDGLQPVIRSIHRHLRKAIKSLVKEKGTIYAQYQSDQCTKWAPVTLKNQHLLLHSLRDGNPPNDGFIIPYDYVRRLVPADRATIFLDIGTEEETLRPVFIRLGNTIPQCAKQMELMCSGEKGVSHRGTCFYKYNEKEHSIHGGDYENNNGSGGRSIVTDLDECYDSSRSYHFLNGSLIADRFSTRFSIRLQNINKGVSGCIGTVKEGLSILKKLSKVQFGMHNIIKDCGLFLPMTVQEEEEEDAN